MKLVQKIDLETGKEYLSNVAEDKHYIHNQNEPTLIWNITHNLNKKPSVNVVDSAGKSVIGDIIYIDTNNLRIEFTAVFAGIAYLN